MIIPWDFPRFSKIPWLERIPWWCRKLCGTQGSHGINSTHDSIGCHENAIVIAWIIHVLRSYCQINHSRHHKLLSQMVSNWIICLKSWHWLGQLIWIARKIRPQGNYKPFTPSNSPDNDSLLKIKEVKVLFIVLSCQKCQFSSLLALYKNPV